MRYCGYVEIQNPHKNNEISFARGLNAGRHYPRFHIYLETGKDDRLINLHLDAKQPSYEGTAAHGGEYEGKIVEDEAARIQIISGKYIIGAEQKTLGFAKKSWVEKLLDLFLK